MKKRIIAALTALVMVVTMIPVSAFAATYDVDQVEALIARAIVDNKVTYDAVSTTLKEANDAYGSLLPSDQTKVKNKELLEAANDAVLDCNDFVATFKAKSADLKPGSLKSTGDYASVNNEDVVKAFVAAYNNVMNGQFVGESGAVTVTLTLTEAQKVEVLGADNIGKAVALTDNGNWFQQTVSDINKIGAVTQEDLDSVTAKTYKLGYTKAADMAKVANSLVNVKEADKNYLYLAERYADYLKIKEKTDAYVKLQADYKRIDDALKTRNTADAVKTVMEGSDKAAKDAFVKALADAKVIVEKNGVAVKDDFEATDVTYAELRTHYLAAQKAFDEYTSLADVTLAIRNLPTVAEVKAADYDKLMEYAKQLAAIDENLAKLTDVYESKYKPVKAEIEEMLASYADKNARIYAEKLANVIKTFPERAGRGDIDAVNSALTLVKEYAFAINNTYFYNQVKLLGVDANYTNTIEARTHYNSSALKTELDKIDANLNKKFVDAVNFIIADYDADQTAIDGLKNIIVNSTAITNVIEAGKVNDAAKVRANKEVAEKDIKDFKEGYAKLNKYAKADFDKNVADNVTVYVAVYERIDAAEAVIAKYDISAEDTALAVDTVKDMKHLADTRYFPEKDLKNPGSKAYAEASALVAKIDANMQREGVALYIKLNNNADLTKYNEIKEMMAIAAGATDAAKNTIKAIDALTVLDPDKKPVDKATLDSVIDAYKTANTMYNNLSATDKSFVDNYGKIATVKAGIDKAIVAVFADEVNKIQAGTADLTENQKNTIASCTLMLEEYKDLYDIASATDATDLGKKATAAYTTYYAAVTKMNNEIKDEAVKEYQNIVPLLLKAKNHVNTLNVVKVDKTTARDIVAAVSAYENLSDAAKKLHPISSDSKLQALSGAYNDARGLILDYATVIVEDQKYTGSAIIPEIVVKDANGVVIPSTQYDLSISGNVAPGEAKVVVTAKADGLYTGVKEATFKIIAPELAKVNVTGVLVNDGKIRVKFDSVDVEGVKYEVAYKETNLGADAEYKTIVSDDTNVLIENLKRNTKYTVKVRAILGDDVQGEYSDLAWAIATKGGKYVLPAADAPTVLTNTGKLRVKSDIAGIDGDVKVQVYYKKTSEPSSAYKFVNGDDSVLIEKLAKNTQYSVKVRYYIKDVKGEKAFGKFSPIVHATTR